MAHMQAQAAGVNGRIGQVAARVYYPKALFLKQRASKDSNNGNSSGGEEGSGEGDARAKGFAASAIISFLETSTAQQVLREAVAYAAGHMPGCVLGKSEEEEEAKEEAGAKAESRKPAGSKMQRGTREAGKAPPVPKKNARDLQQIASAIEHNSLQALDYLPSSTARKTSTAIATAEALGFRAAMDVSAVDVSGFGLGLYDGKKGALGTLFGPSAVPALKKCPAAAGVGGGGKAQLELVVVALGKLGSGVKKKTKLGSVMKKLFRGKKEKEEVERRKEARIRILNEVLSTEETFVNCLKMLRDNYLCPLRQPPWCQSPGSLARDDRKYEALGEEDLQAIFCNLEDIASTHEDFLAALQSRATQWVAGKSRRLHTVGDLFLQFGSSFRKLAAFVAAFEGSSQHITELNEAGKAGGGKGKAWLEFVNSPPRSPRELQQCLITPVQRVPRYLLLLGDLASNTAEDHPDYEHLHKALQLIGETAVFVNEAARAKDQLKQLVTLQSEIVSGPSSKFPPPQILSSSFKSSQVAGQGQGQRQEQGQRAMPALGVLLLRGKFKIVHVANTSKVQGLAKLCKANHARIILTSSALLLCIKISSLASLGGGGGGAPPKLQCLLALPLSDDMFQLSRQHQGFALQFSPQRAFDLFPDCLEKQKVISKQGTKGDSKQGSGRSPCVLMVQATQEQGRAWESVLRKLGQVAAATMGQQAETDSAGRLSARDSAINSIWQSLSRC